MTFLFGNMQVLVAAGVWWVGARFTLDWLRSTGVAVDALGLLAWGFPLAITALEMGMLVARSRTVWAWLFWGGVLIFDIYTTAVGRACSPRCTGARPRRCERATSPMSSGGHYWRASPTARR